MRNRLLHIYVRKCSCCVLVFDGGLWYKFRVDDTLKGEFKAIVAAPFFLIFLRPEGRIYTEKKDREMARISTKRHTASYYRQLTDEELLETELIFTGDPTAQLGVVETMPEGAEFDRIVNRYKSPDWTFCVFRRHRHKRGFTVRVTSGHLVLVGKDCGKDYTGEDWGAFDADFKYAVQRQRYLRWSGKIRPLLPEILDALRGWEDTAWKFNKQKFHFRQLAPELFDQLATAAGKRNGQIKIEERRRDLAAEARRAEKETRSNDEEKNSKEDDKPIYTDQVVWSGRIDGIEYFWPASPLSTARKALPELKNVEQILSKPHLTNTEFQRCRKIIRDQARLLEECAAMIGASQRLCRPAMMATIVEFANWHPSIPGSFELQEGNLVRLKPKAEILKAGGTAAPDLEPVNALLKALALTEEL